MAEDMNIPGPWRYLDGVQVWLVSGSEPPQPVDALYALLSADECSRMERLAFPALRERFVISRGCLRLILGHCTGSEPAGIRFDYGTQGKPHLYRGDTPTDVEFNVSHSGDLYLYALTRGSNVGIDVELMREDTDIDRLAARYFAPGEVRRLTDVPAGERRAAFYRCWTRKEAYLKARGCGISGELDKFEVNFLASEPPAVLRTRPGVARASSWRVWDLVPEGGFAAALVTGHRGPP